MSELEQLRNSTTERDARIAQLEDALTICKDALETHVADSKLTSNAYEAHRQALCEIDKVMK